MTQKILRCRSVVDRDGRSPDSREPARPGDAAAGAGRRPAAGEAQVFPVQGSKQGETGGERGRGGGRGQRDSPRREAEERERRGGW